MQIYIIKGNKKEGPFDLITMIKKIRNGSVKKGTLVADANGNEVKPIPAGKHDKLEEFFIEIEKEQEAEAGQDNNFSSYSFGKVILSGWQFLQTNPVVSVYTGVFLLSVIMLVTVAHLFLPEPLRMLGYFVVMVFSFYLLSAYMLTLLRVSHGQPVEMSQIFRRVGWHTQSLLVAASIVSLFTLMGMVLLAVPGLFVLAFYIFTPLLITEKDMEFWDAMEASRKAIMERGTDMLGIIFGLVVMNFISAMLVVPLLIVLPVTFCSICELYDEFFYHS